MNNLRHVVCPHRYAVNRLRRAYSSTGTACPCHRPLFTGHPVELTAGNFQTHLTRNDIPVLVDFWAPWCEPCKMMAPSFAQAAAQLEPHVRLAKINTEAE